VKDSLIEVFKHIIDFVLTADDYTSNEFASVLALAFDSRYRRQIGWHSHLAISMTADKQAFLLSSYCIDNNPRSYCQH
jgi:hypothetical protein